MVHLPLRELNFGGQKSDSTLQGIGKMKKEQRPPDAGAPFYYVKMQIQKKVRILDWPFDKNEPAADQGAQQ